MDDVKYKDFVIDLLDSIKDQALNAKHDLDHSNKEDLDFNKGYVMAFHSVMSAIKNQILIFKMNEKELGLDDFDPDAELLSLHKR